MTLPNDSPVDRVDPGADVQRRFRYQHAVGVALLVQAIADPRRTHTALLCEHLEDLILERGDGLWDAYQVKTRDHGTWTLSDPGLKDAIGHLAKFDGELTSTG